MFLSSCLMTNRFIFNSFCHSYFLSCPILFTSMWFDLCFKRLNNKPDFSFFSSSYSFDVRLEKMFICSFVPSVSPLSHRPFSNLFPQWQSPIRIRIWPPLSNFHRASLSVIAEAERRDDGDEMKNLNYLFLSLSSFLFPSPNETTSKITRCRHHFYHDHLFIHQFGHSSISMIIMLRCLRCSPLSRSFTFPFRLGSWSFLEQNTFSIVWSGTCEVLRSIHPSAQVFFLMQRTFFTSMMMKKTREEENWWLRLISVCRCHRLCRFIAHSPCTIGAETAGERHLHTYTHISENRYFVVRAKGWERRREKDALIFSNN